MMGEMKAKAEAAAAASTARANAAANLAVSRQPPMPSGLPSLGVNAQSLSAKNQVTTQGASTGTCLSSTVTQKNGSSSSGNEEGQPTP
jgi:hypothetical protein